MQSQLLRESQSGLPSESRLLPQDLIAPSLVSERLVLRAPDANDIDAISHLANNINVASKVSRMPHPYTPKDAESFVASAATGGVLLLAADVLARSLMAPQELPVGVLTALLGGGYLLWLLRRTGLK